MAHRVRQFFAAVTARVSSFDQALAEQYLSPKQFALFRQMRVNDRRHAIEVLRRLLAADYDDPDLLQAALLHDAGKCQAQIGIATRVAVVVLARVDPRIIDFLAGSGLSGWRRSLYVHRHHATIGAALAAEAGSSPTVVSLIANHSLPPMEALAHALYQADDES